MFSDISHERQQSLLRQRNLFALTSAGLGLALVIAGSLAATRDREVVLVPTVPKQLTVSSAGVEADYLELVTRDAALVLRSAESDRLEWFIQSVIGRIGQGVSDEFPDLRLVEILNRLRHPVAGDRPRSAGGQGRDTRQLEPLDERIGARPRGAAMQRLRRPCAPALLRLGAGLGLILCPSVHAADRALACHHHRAAGGPARVAEMADGEAGHVDDGISHGFPFALSLSKGCAWHTVGFDKLSPNGIQANTPAVSCMRAETSPSWCSESPNVISSTVRRLK